MNTIGVDVGGTTIKLGVVEDGERIVYRDTQPTPRTPEGVVDLFCGMIKQALARYPGSHAGISICGSFNLQGNMDANQLDFWDIPIHEMTRSRMGYPLRIENDGICALLAEQHSGVLKGCSSGVMITLGTGIGGGVLVSGKPYRGFHGMHAELGHMITHVGGKKCTCGQTGCWEAYASATALSELANGMSPREVLTRVAQGELADVWAIYINELAQGLLGLCSLFYPEKIAIGGGLSNAGSMLLDGVRGILEKDTGFITSFRHVSIVPARHLNDAGILGAAALAKEDLPKA